MPAAAAAATHAAAAFFLGRLFWLLLLLPLAAIARDPCYGGDYLFNLGNRFTASTTFAVGAVPRYYCEGVQLGGGSCNIGDGWTLYSDAHANQVCGYHVGQTNSGRDCQCTWRGCGGSGPCQCTSSESASVMYCYTKATLCPICPPTSAGVNQFRTGCGCVDCSNTSPLLQQFYASTTLMALQHRCTETPYQQGYVCGQGTCQDCPTGHQCSDQFYALPCPAGYFQNQTGKGICDKCVLTEINTYLDLTGATDPVAACDSVSGWAGKIRYCDECTDLPSATVKFASGGGSSLCPPRQLSYGRYAKKRTPLGGNCLPCDPCTGRLYARPNITDRLCVTDQSGARCVEMYNSNTDTGQYTCKNTADARDCFAARAMELPRMGPMPWVPGFQRTLSEFRYLPGGNARGEADDGLLPFYSACDPGGDGLAYRLAHYTTPYRARRTQTNLLDNRSWEFGGRMDCELATTQECAAGFYAIVSPNPGDNGLTVLSECRPCAGGGFSPGGLQTFCVCPPGTITFSALAAALPSVTLGAGDLGRSSSALANEETCLACYTDVAWRHADGAIYQEALVCAGNTTLFTRCNGARQYVLPTEIGCGQCAAGAAAGAVLSADVCPQVDIDTIAQPRAGGGVVWAHPPRDLPLPNRTGCHMCPAGTHIAVVSGAVVDGTQGYGCVPCETGTFQPLPGQCACAPRRQGCPPGQQVVQSVLVAQDPTSDFACTACDVACKPGEITIRAPNDVNNTCDGAGGAFFACYDAMGDGSAPPLAPGQRLQFPSPLDVGVPQESRAVVHACDPALLPPNAEFVSHAVPAGGVECYFACLHGVNPAAAQAYQTAIAAYVHTQRADLIPFLPATTTSTSTAATGAVDTLQMPSVWRYSTPAADNDLSPAADVWTLGVPWHVTGTGVADVWQNTFLYDEAFLLQQQQQQQQQSSGLLCLSASQAYSAVACPTGFNPPAITSDAARAAACARNGRTSLLRIQRGGATLYATASGASPVCVANDALLAAFRIPCGVACLDQRLLDAHRTLHLEPPINALWYSRLSWLAYFLEPGLWNGAFGQFNPYEPLATRYEAATNNNASSFTATPAPFNNDAACATRCALRPASPDGAQAAVNTFRYSTDAHAADGTSLLVATLPAGGITACVPCDYGGLSQGLGKAVCETLFTPPRYFRNDVCRSPPAGMAELTADTVCSQCNPTGPNGATLLAFSTDAYYDWWTQRLEQGGSGGFSSAIVNGVNQWQAIQCRYACPAGLTSNGLSPADYIRTPCVPCPTASSLCAGFAPTSVPAFLSVPPNAQCGLAGNYAPYAATCLTCEGTLQVLTPTGAPTYVFFQPPAGAPNPALDPSDCYALCNPSLFHSFDLLANGPPVPAGGDPLPFGTLRCIPCGGSGDAFSCAGRCPDGKYHNASAAAGQADCLPCTTDPCADGLYREACFAGTASADARCLPCPASALQNSIVAAVAATSDPRLNAAIAAVAGVATRKWLLLRSASLSSSAPYVWAVPSPHPDQCALACINNHAWINATTGLSPFSSSAAGGGGLAAAPELVCVPCASAFIVNGGDPHLYAVWNDVSNFTTTVPAAGSALASMRGLLGGCAPCPGLGLRDVVATSTRMCELLPGYTDGYQAPDAVLVNLSVVVAVAVGGSTGTTAAFADEPPPTPPTQHAPSLAQRNLDRRRLLLAAAAATTGFVPGQLTMTLAASAPRGPAASTARPANQLVPVVRAPAFAGQDHFACCDALADGSDACQRVGACGYAPLAARRLLQYVSAFDASVQDWLVNGTGTPPPEACYGGTFKPDRGDGPCYYCPVGSSTTAPRYAAADSGKQCVCLPGYFATRTPALSASETTADANASRLDAPLQRCTACPNGTFRSSTQNDSACTPCPPRMHTLGTASAYCYCLPGTYPDVGLYDACVVCEANFYCADNARTRCPDHSVSPPGSDARGDCVCDPRTHYGDLSLPGGVCLPRPPGYTCPNVTSSTTGGAAACGCAGGWTAVAHTAPGTGQRYLECTNPCRAGQYAQLQPRSQNLAGCVPCPPDTYSADGSLIGACTPCPTGRGTSGQAGMTAAANCTCLAGVLNRSSSTTTAACEGCAAGQYLDLAAKRCAPCPPGWTSVAGTIGRVSCLCPPGAYAVGAACAPCPLNTYSSGLGLACTRCPSGRVTDTIGQASRLACHAPALI